MNRPHPLPNQRNPWFRAMHPAIVVASGLGLLLLLAWASLFNGIDILYPIDKTEALQLELARQMSATGDWVTPSIDNHIYFDKPPLPYWIGSFFLTLGAGDNIQTWYPRIGAAFAGAIGTISTFLLCLHGNNDQYVRRLSRAGCAAAILLLMPFYSGFSRVALHDIYLTASITLALTILFLHSQLSSKETWKSILHGTILGCTLGMGVLAKGLLAPVIVISVTAVFLFASQRTKACFSDFNFIAFAILSFVLIASPWHLAAWQAHGTSFLETYLGRTQLTRFTSELDNHSGPWFFYLLIYPAITAPWILPAAHSLIQNSILNIRLLRQKLQSNTLQTFCAIWILVVIFLLSLASTKLPHYILPSLPPTAIAASYFFFPLRPDSSQSKQFSKFLLVGTGAIILIASFILILFPSALLPISRNSPDFSLALRGYLTSAPVVASALILGVAGCFLGAKVNRHAELLLGIFWGLSICSIFLFVSPRILRIYYVYHQLPRLQLADQALLQANSTTEPIQVVGKSWYSVKIRTSGRAEILQKGKAFTAGDSTATPDCGSSRLVLGPTADVQAESQRCPASSLTLLSQQQSGRLSLARLAPKA